MIPPIPSQLARYSPNTQRTRSPAARHLYRAIAAVLVFLLTATGTQAQKPARPLRVATRIVPPFVFEENGSLVGFSIDLWRGLAGRIGVTYEFSQLDTVPDLLAAVKSGRADVAVAAVSITAERDREFDFSQPIFESGLQILVPARPSRGGSVSRLLAAVLSPAFFRLVGVILVMILVPAHIVWFFERRHEDGIVRTKRYFPGIFLAGWWAASTLATQAEEMPKSTAGRIVAVVWMFTSVVFVAYFTAVVTTSLTVQELHGDIKGPDDLPGKRVATITGSTAAQYLREQKSQILGFPQIDPAYRAMLAGRADAVVYDAPILLYYAAHNGRGNAEVIGPVFRKENYGILLRVNSTYRKPIDGALLALREDGTYERLYNKWFGGR